MEKTIAIGALGGSGTRAVAQVFIDAGIYMGDFLNVYYDNLVFTALFKNPKWKSKASEKEIQKRLALFNKYMHCRLNLFEAAKIWRIAKKNPLSENLPGLRKMLRANLLSPQKTLNIWGWKEPNTHFYVEELLKFFPKLKYIHVVRHGLDMALSNNKQQLNNWGQQFGVIINEGDSENQIVNKQLAYWVATTKRIETLKQKYTDQIFILDYALTISDSRRILREMFAFCEIGIDEKVLDKLAKIPRVTATHNRYKDFDLQKIEPSLLEEVKKLGFEI